MISSIQSGAQQAAALAALQQSAGTEQGADTDQVADSDTDSGQQSPRTVQAQANPVRGQKVDTSA